jgi:magnesium-transporting ATPase (P-type)
MEFKKASFGPPGKDGMAWTYLPRITPPPGFTPLMTEHDLTLEILNAMPKDSGMFAAAHKFYTAIAVCHTVVPEMKNGVVSYQAESPDEEAIVLGAKAAGYDFCELAPRGGKDVCTIKIGDLTIQAILSCTRVWFML